MEALLLYHPMYIIKNLHKSFNSDESPEKATHFQFQLPKELYGREKETQNRFLMTFGKYTKVFTEKEHPLAITIKGIVIEDASLLKCHRKEFS